MYDLSPIPSRFLLGGNTAQGSKNVTILFVISSILLSTQAAISAVAFDSDLGAFVAGTSGVVILIIAHMAYTGQLSFIGDQTVTYTKDYTTAATVRTTTTYDTGQRIQSTPCCGICTGVGIIILVLLFAGDLLEDIFPAIIPGLLAGVLSIVAGIVFAIEYKGPWTAQVY